MGRLFSSKSYRFDEPVNAEDDKYTFVHKIMEYQDFSEENSLKIFEAAENGEVQEFGKLVSSDSSILHVCDSRGRTAAHYASVGNHVDILKIIVKNKGVFGVLDDDGNSPLHLAAMSGAVETIDFLLQNGADPKALNKRGQAPLHLASELGKTSSLSAMRKHLKLLDVNQAGEQGRTPLHVACIHDQFECVKILIVEMKASIHRACSQSYLPVHEAARHGSRRALETLLCSAAEHGCPAEEMMNFADTEGNLPLHFAIQSRDIKTVELCLKSGSKISSARNDSSSAVHLACVQGSTEIVELMLYLQPEEKDKCLESFDLDRRTPLHYAAMFNHVDLVKLLVNQGAELNPLDKHTCTPLHLAASRNARKTIKYLVEIGADVTIQDINGRTVLHTIIHHNGDLNKIIDGRNHINFSSILEAPDKKGNTALHAAAVHGDANSVKKLLAMGSSITVENVDGDNVFQMACRFGRTEIIQMIVDHPQFSAVMNDTNHSGRAPVHAAAQEGHFKVLQVLMKKGAHFLKDNEGKTPVHLAAEKGHRDIVNFILISHPHLVDDADNHVNTPLHSATLHNQAKVVELLLHLKCELTYNNDGCSAIDLALMNKFVEVAHILVTHPTRADEVLDLTKGKHRCIMEALIAKMPAVAKAVLDNGVKASMTEKPDSPSFSVEYDFKCLSKPEECHKEKHSSRYLPILKDMVRHERVGLLSHELSLKYMEMKWRAYGKYFQFATLIFYLCYLLIVNSVATNQIERDFKFYTRFKWFNESEEECLAENYSCEPPTFVGRGEREVEAFRLYRKNTNNYEWRKFVYVKIWVMALVAAFNLLLEFFSMFHHGIKYCKTIDTWVWIAMNISCLTANFFQITARQVKANAAVSYDLVNPSLANAVFMGWFYLFIMMQRFDAIGLYVSMFLEIVKTLLRVLVVFSALILAFALTFYVLLSNGNHLAFTNIPMSTIRTFMMMMGDVDFTSTFVYPHFCDEMELYNRTNIRLYSTLDECKLIRRIPHPHATFLAVCVFMLFMPIVMMNLLIGLAVGDIESVRKNAQFKRLAMQVQSHINIEKTLPSFILRRLNKTSVVEYPNARKDTGCVKNLVEIFRNKEEEDEGDEVGSEADYLREAVRDYKVKLDQLTSDMDNMKAMLQLICTKLSVEDDSTDAVTTPVVNITAMKDESTEKKGNPGLQVD